MTTENEVVSDLELPSPGTYYERNYFPEDIEFLNGRFRGRLVVIDDATPKELEIMMALQPDETELTYDSLIERVNELIERGWFLLLAPSDDARAWRRLLGRALHKQMGHFRTFYGVTQGERRNVHFFMMEKTPQFKRGIRKLELKTTTPLDADKLNRLVCIAGDSQGEGDLNFYTGGDVNPVLAKIME